MSERDDCAFCSIAAGRLEARVVLDEESTLAFLDRRPLFPGHVLVVPRLHAETLADLPPVRVDPLFQAVRRMTVAVERALEAEGTFVAMNHRVSQSVPHLHVHVVPRRRGDGLRGFFWPRHDYDDDPHADRIAESLRAALARAPHASRGDRGTKP